ncbi:MAG: cyclic pyranopterin monophosphate synthase MoaC [Cyanobacteria bacterium P01_D01_bin.123]
MATSDLLSHVDTSGTARMVDVSAKSVTTRQATAEARVRMQLSTLETILSGNAPKGSVIETARIAGVMAAKQTANLIPLCHPLPLAGIDIDIVPDRELPGLVVQATVKTNAPTGVEMESLTAVSVASLTLYDMAKALEKSIVITDIRLVRKSGGKSGEYVAPDLDVTV